MYICFVYIIENDSRLRTHTHVDVQAIEMKSILAKKEKETVSEAMMIYNDMQNEFIRRQSSIFVLTENIRCLYTYRHTADIEDTE